MVLEWDQLYSGDCLELLDRLPAGSVDLAFADPPFNIGFSYADYDDRKTRDEYVGWCRGWISKIIRALKPDGTFWLAIGDEFAAELKVLAQNELGLLTRSWVVWYYTFGVNCRAKFSRSHAHLFHFVKDPHRYTFRADDPAVRVPSARQLVYADRRANPRGRLPDDTWILRPQDLPEGFLPSHDTWYFARVAGTFKERSGFHGCQMPEQLLGRIVRVSSHRGERVLDPFAGSGTTLAVARKLGRRWMGFEISSTYVQQARRRLDGVREGDPLEGPADPICSAPATGPSGRTPRGRRDVLVKKDRAAALQTDGTSASVEDLPTRWRSVCEQVRRAVIDAYLATHQGHSADRLIADPVLQRAFLSQCRCRKLPGSPNEWFHLLLRLRKTGKLPRLEKPPPRTAGIRDMEQYDFASEMALARISRNGSRGATVDDILCTPQLASQFDRLAKGFAPGFTQLEYRWAALSLRKRAGAWRRKLRTSRVDWSREALPDAIACRQLKPERLQGTPGVYLLRSRSRAVYAGATRDLGARLVLHQRLLRCAAWQDIPISSVVVHPVRRERHVLQLKILEWFRPAWNHCHLLLA